MAGKSKGMLVVVSPEEKTALVAESKARRDERMRVARQRMERNERTRYNPVTRQAKDIIISAIAAGIRVSDACELANVAERTVYTHRGQDAKFAAEWEMALEASCEPYEAALEEVAFDAPADSMARVKAIEALLNARNRRYRRDNQNARAVLTQKDADGSSKSIMISSGDYIPS